MMGGEAPLMPQQIVLVPHFPRAAKENQSGAERLHGRCAMGTQCAVRTGHSTPARLCPLQFSRCPATASPSSLPLALARTQPHTCAVSVPTAACRWSSACVMLVTPAVYKRSSTRAMFAPTAAHRCAISCAMRRHLYAHPLPHRCSRLVLYVQIFPSTDVQALALYVQIFLSTDDQALVLYAHPLLHRCSSTRSVCADLSLNR